MNGYKLEVSAITSTFYLEVLVSSTQLLLVEQALKLHTFLPVKGQPTLTYSNLDKMK